MTGRLHTDGEGEHIVCRILRARGRCRGGGGVLCCSMYCLRPSCGCMGWVGVGMKHVKDVSQNEARKCGTKLMWGSCSAAV